MRTAQQGTRQHRVTDDRESTGRQHRVTDDRESTGRQHRVRDDRESTGRQHRVTARQHRVTGSDADGNRNEGVVVNRFSRADGSGQSRARRCVGGLARRCVVGRLLDRIGWRADALSDGCSTGSAGAQMRCRCAVLSLFAGLSAAGPVAPGLDPIGILTSVAGPITTAVLGTGGVAIGIGVTVWALKTGWGLFRGLIDEPIVRGMTWNYDGSHPGGAVGERDSTVGGGWDSDGWSQSQEYQDEMDQTGPDHEHYHEATSGEQDAAAVSYLDRYR